MNTTRERPLAAKVALVTGGSRGIGAAPHIGYVARDLYRTFYGDAVKNIARWLGDRYESNDTGKE
jgi:NAD(P)-dependent dehydrogenase (short-subunit alcohol dehydrogenase family)